MGATLSVCKISKSENTKIIFTAGDLYDSTKQIAELQKIINECDSSEKLEVLKKELLRIERFYNLKP